LIEKLFIIDYYWLSIIIIDYHKLSLVGGVDRGEDRWL